MNQKAAARNMGHVNKTEELNTKIAKALTQMAEAQQTDQQYVNATTEANKKTMETTMDMM